MPLKILNKIKISSQILLAHKQRKDYHDSEMFVDFQGQVTT